MKQFFSVSVPKKLFVLAILLRILVMPFFFHPDIKTFNFQSSFLGSGVVNIYDYLVSHKEELPLKEEFVYFPLTYYFLGGYQIIASPLLGDNFNAWLSNANVSAIEQVGVFRYLFILKFPYLLLDLLVMFTLGNLVEEENRKKISLLWLFNPFTIVMIYMFGNIDIIPVSLTVLSLLFASKGRLKLSSFLLCVAAGFKVYPLLFIPFLIFRAKDFKTVLQIILISVIFLTTIIVPVASTSFFSSALASGLTTRIVNSGLSIGFGELVIFPVVLLSGLFFFALSDKREIELEKYFFSALIIIFSLIHFHIQWLLWISPFVCLILSKNTKYNAYLLPLSVLAFCVPFLYQDKYMNFSLFTPISNIFNLIPTPFSVIQKFYDPYQIQSILHSAFAGGSLLFVWKLLKEKLA